MSRKKTHEEFVAEMKILHPNLEVIGIYVNNKVRILIKDNYGLLNCRPDMLIRGVTPSISSSINQTEYMINQFIETHGYLYDYSKAIYNNANSKVCIICPVHGEFWQKPASHVRGYGCRKCSQSDLNYTTSEFIKTATRVHNDRYDYSKVNYINSYTKVCIICPIHGEFWQIPSNHTRGYGCFKCKKYGWSKTSVINNANGRANILYKIHCWNETESFYKIGRTMDSIKRRFSRNGLMPYNYRVISELHGDAGYIYDLENKEHRRHKHIRYKPDIWFAGETECFLRLI